MPAQQTRMTFALSPAEKRKVEALARKRKLTPSALLRELAREATAPKRKKSQPKVATRLELKEKLTALARDGDRQAIKDLARMLREDDKPKPPAKPEEPADPADKFRGLHAV